NDVVIEGRNVVLLVLVLPLVGFDSQKGQAKDQSQQQHLHLKLAIAELSRANRHGNGQAAANQDDRVECPHSQVEAATGGGEFRKIPTAINQISAEHAAEEH